MFDTIYEISLYNIDISHDTIDISHDIQKKFAFAYFSIIKKSFHVIFSLIKLVYETVVIFYCKIPLFSEATL